MTTKRLNIIHDWQVAPLQCSVAYQIDPFGSFLIMSSDSIDTRGLYFDLKNCRVGPKREFFEALLITF